MSLAGKRKALKGVNGKKGKKNSNPTKSET